MATEIDPRTYPISFIPPSMMEMYALHSVALVCIIASLVGSAMVIGSTVYRSKYGTIGERFPLYVSVIDFLWSLSHSIDHTLMMFNKGESPPPTLCKGLGATLALFLMAQVMLLNIIAVSMFLTVYRGWSLSYGPGDWVLFVLTFGVPVVYTGVGLWIGAFGPDLYWCYLNPAVTSGWIMWSITFIAAIACIALPAFCYYMIYRKITETTRRLHSANHPHTSDYTTSGSDIVHLAPPQRGGAVYPPPPPAVNVGSGKRWEERVNSGAIQQQQQQQQHQGVQQVWDGTKQISEGMVARKNRRIVEKLLQYELVLIITFSSLIVYGASIVARQEPLWMVFLVVICFNSAGWLNAVVYFYQERKKRMASRDREFDGAATGSKW